ncbi:MAG: hypothetical protein JSW23_05690, partial [Planctomycetota bacterium]
ILSPPATIYYVDDDGSDDNDGLTPENAFATIQKGIDSTNNRDTVIVADGTYTGEGNNYITFLGKAITVRSESGPKNCIIDCNGTDSGFGFHNGEGADSLLDGFTVTNGRAGVGAIYCSSASPTVANCVITGNTARNGGGLCFRGSSPTITDCTIKGNFAERGGAIYCDNNSSPTIVNCTIADNSAGFRGGAIYCKDSSLTLINCTLAGNSTTYFGGAMYIIDSNVAISDCTFTGNSAEDGGGVYNRESTVTVDACIFKRNRAEYSGGALYNHRATQKVTNSLFTGNSANAGGAIMNPPNRLINCTFTGNSAYHGGAINYPHYHFYSFNGEPGQPPDTPIENCILWGDTPDEIHPGGHYWYLSDADTVWSSVKFSNVQGGYPGQGNIDADPCFVDPGYWADANDPNIIVGPNDPNAIWVDGDYRLLPTSPCIDAGDPNYIPEPNETDLDGRPRVIGGRIDMGAYEYIHPLAAQVRISPNTLNLRSQGRWVSCYILLPEDCSAADIDPNSIFLEDEIPPDKVVSYGRLAMAKFSRSALQELLSDLQTPAEVELLVSGQLID